MSETNRDFSRILPVIRANNIRDKVINDIINPELIKLLGERRKLLRDRNHDETELETMNACISDLEDRLLDLRIEILDNIEKSEETYMILEDIKLKVNDLEDEIASIHNTIRTISKIEEFVNSVNGIVKSFTSFIPAPMV